MVDLTVAEDLAPTARGIWLAGRGSFHGHGEVGSGAVVLGVLTERGKVHGRHKQAWVQERECENKNEEGKHGRRAVFEGLEPDVSEGVHLKMDLRKSGTFEPSPSISALISQPLYVLPMIPQQTGNLVPNLAGQLGVCVKPAFLHL